MMAVLMRHSFLRTLLTAVTTLSPLLIQAEDIALPIRAVFQSKDSLSKPTDLRADAVECLQGLCWNPETFAVRCLEPQGIGVNAILQFPSPKPLGVTQNDIVTVEWYAVTDEGVLRKAPAIVVVHESGRSMTVGRAVGRGLRDRGLHAFMVQLPFYGARRPAGMTAKDQKFADVMSQSIADVRRTRDAVAVLPGVDARRISLQGTSLGGFLSATTAGVDSAFENVFVLLAGGELPKLIETGKRETAQVRALLMTQGFVGERMHELLNRFEPNRLAHRLRPENVWVFTATFDTTVPPAHGHSFAKAVGLQPSHHIQMPATHYSGVIFLPQVLDTIAENAGGHALK
jgi:dienelactone hydrolase